MHTFELYNKHGLQFFKKEKKKVDQWIGEYLLNTMVKFEKLL